MKLINKKSLSILFALFLGCSVIGVVSSFSNKENIKVSADSIDINNYTTANSYHNSGNASSLLTELRRLTSPGKSKSYDDLWTTYLSAFVKSDGYIKDYYSSISRYTSDNQDRGSGNAEGQYYNREHSIPKSWWGGSTSGQGADPFIVVPTDKIVNGKRSNYPFGMVKNATYSSSGGYSKLGSSDSDTWGYSGTVFEPNDEVKGDLARCTLYAIARYSASSGWTSGEGDAIFSGNASTNFGLTNYAVKLFTYWNNLDKPDAWEQGVNNRLAAIQGNRNPFIDHPEYVNTLWKNVSGMTPYGGDVPTPPTPTGSVSISKTSISLTTGNTTTISATSSDSSAITWTTSNQSVASLSQTQVSSGTSITVTAGIAGSATLTAKATIDSVEHTKQCVVTVTDGGSSGGEYTYTLITSNSSLSNGDKVVLKTKEATPIGISGYNNDNDATASIEESDWVQYIVGSATSSGFTLYDSSASSYIAPVSKNGFKYGTAATCSADSEGRCMVGDRYLVKNGTYYRCYTSLGEYIPFYVYKASLAVTLSSIEVKNAPETLIYTEGDCFDPTGLLLTANYSDGSKKTIEYAGNEEDFTFTPSLTTPLEVSDEYVTITYGDESVNQVITVNELVVLSSISVSEYISSFYVGDEFSFDGIVTAHYSNGDSEEVTWFATFTGYNMSSVGLQTVTVSYTEDEITKTTTYQITVSKNSLSSISVSGQKTTFDVGDTFSFGGTVTATYLKGNDSDVTNSATFSGYNMSTSGNQTVTVSYTEDNVTKTTTYQITVNDIQPVIEGDAYTNSGVLTYYKVTSTNEIVSGKYYAIVCESELFMMDGSLTTLDAVSNTILTGSITSSKFDVDSGTDSAFMITTSANGYTIKSKSGYYIGRTADSNGLNTSTTTQYDNSISFDSDGNAMILSSEGSYLRYNSSNNQERFRYYSSSTYTKQNVVQLYRIEVEKYAEDFFTYVQCDNGVTKPSNWTLMNSKHTPLSSASKTTLKNTTKNVNGNIVQRAVARYDYIVGKYLKTGLDVSYTDFMERNPTPVYGNSYLPTYKREENDFAIIAVVVVSSSILCFTLLMCLKKKRK